MPAGRLPTFRVLSFTQQASLCERDERLIFIHDRERHMKRLIRASALALLASLASGVALAQAAFPTRAVRIVVPFAASGSSDNATRILAEQLSKKWKQPVVVDNRPGAYGSLGASMVAKSPPDGYTILLTPVSIGTINLFVKNPGFDALKELTPVAQVARGDYVLIVPNSMPVNTIGEFANYARTNPGKVFHGTFGGGSQLAFTKLGELLHFQVTNVPYRGESPAIIDLMSGQINAMFATLVTARPYIESGKVKALGLASKNRSPIEPNIKSADESGAKGFDVDFWFGLTVPTGTPPEVIRVINADVRDVLSHSDVKGQYFAMGLTASPTTPEEFGKIVQYESVRWVETAKLAGIVPQ
jgi:tripartite-type tricarboxylate transporter receptor subunit TctC